VGAIKDPQSVRVRVHKALLELLAHAGLRLPPGGDEQVQASRLLDLVAGRQSVERFRELAGWLRRFRVRLTDPDGPSALEYALDRLCPNLAGTTPDGARYTHNVSFRLHARARILKRFREEGWVTDEGDLHRAARKLNLHEMANVLNWANEASDEDRGCLTDVLTQEPRSLAGTA
jgi:hypothetical protein